jgi:hypothetical protein
MARNHNKMGIKAEYVTNDNIKSPVIIHAPIIVVRNDCGNSMPYQAWYYS